MLKLSEIQFALAEEPYLNLISKLINFYYKNNYKVLVLCDNQDDLEQIDESLWSFDEISFVPHNIYTQNNMTLSPVLIANKDLIPNIYSYNVLINLSDIIPNKYINFKKVIEIVKDEEIRKNISRNHYKFYKSQGLEILTTKLEDLVNTNSENVSTKENA